MGAKSKDSNLQTFLSIKENKYISHLAQKTGKLASLVGLSHPKKINPVEFEKLRMSEKNNNKITGAARR